LKIDEDAAKKIIKYRKMRLKKLGPEKIWGFDYSEFLYVSLKFILTGNYKPF
jgi:hypothetical protein